eukprot:1157138-Pelagomonas_calceolata.AAC.5
MGEGESGRPGAWRTTLQIPISSEVSSASFFLGYVCCGSPLDGLRAVPKASACGQQLHNCADFSCAWQLDAGHGCLLLKDWNSTGIGTVEQAGQPNYLVEGQIPSQLVTLLSPQIHVP